MAGGFFLLSFAKRLVIGHNSLMKKQKLWGALSLLLLLPFLKANSPAPWPYPDRYTDFSIDPLVMHDDGNYPYNYNYAYTSMITNTGSGYIALDSIYLSDTSTSDMTSSQSGFGYTLFKGQYLPPLASHEIVFYVDNLLTSYEFIVEGHTNFFTPQSITIPVITEVQEKANVNYETGETNFLYYRYGYTMSVEGLNNAYYEGIVEYEYAGQRYASSNLGSGNRNPDYFETLLAMEKEDITVIKVSLVEGRVNSMHNIWQFIYGLIMIGFVLGIVLLIAVPVIIIILVIVHSRRKKRNPI